MAGGVRQNVMALLHYLKPVDGLPDPRGPLSSHIPSLAIAEANCAVKLNCCPRKKTRR